MYDDKGDSLKNGNYRPTNVLPEIFILYKRITWQDNEFMSNKLFWYQLAFLVSMEQNNLTLCQKYHKFPLISISVYDRQAVSFDVRH